MIRRPTRSTHCMSSAASDVYKRQTGGSGPSAGRAKSSPQRASSPSGEDCRTKRAERRADIRTANVCRGPSDCASCLHTPQPVSGKAFVARSS
eukprot:888560-Prymnesium_polylepis.2